MSTDSTTPGGGTAVASRPAESELASMAWVCIVWDDPVNSTAYVAHVFSRYFGFAMAKAEMLMLKVHNEGKAIVASGTREEMERDASAMHSYGLWATVAKGE